MINSEIDRQKERKLNKRKNERMKERIEKRQTEKRKTEPRGGSETEGDACVRELGTEFRGSRRGDSGLAAVGLWTQ